MSRIFTDKGRTGLYKRQAGFGRSCLICGYLRLGKEAP